MGLAMLDYPRSQAVFSEPALQAAYEEHLRIAAPRTLSTTPPTTDRTD